MCVCMWLPWTVSAEKSQTRDKGAGEKREEWAKSAKEASRDREKGENIVITQLPGRHSGKEGVKGWGEEDGGMEEGEEALISPN